jgi:Putative amidoligase enzyme
MTLTTRTNFNEAVGPHVSFSFGRMNPPHFGHEGLINTLISVAKNGAWALFLSKSHDAKKNPLTYDQKLQWVKTLYPQTQKHLVEDPNIKTFLQAAAYLYEKGFRSATFVAGEDDMASMRPVLEQYNGKEVAHGYYNFNPLTFMESPRLTSATNARDAAKSGDIEAFERATRVPPNITVDGKNLFQTVRVGMGLGESFEESIMEAPGIGGDWGDNPKLVKRGRAPYKADKDDTYYGSSHGVPLDLRGLPKYEAKDYFKGSKFGDDDGNNFSVEEVLNFAKSKPEYLHKDFPLSKIKHDLSWWKDNAAQRERMKNADTSYPLLVIKNDDGHLSVADGLNRMKKAVDVEKKKTIDVYVVPKKDIMHLAQKKVNEFAPNDSGDNSEPEFSEEMLRKLASKWWNGNEQEMAQAQNTLTAMGWDIGEDDHYDEGGVFVIQIGDEEGHSYISWPHSALQESIAEAAEKSTKAVAKYQDMPRNGQRCDHCTMWRPPHGCSAVKGKIAANGWCSYYKRSHRKDLDEALLRNDMYGGWIEDDGLVGYVDFGNGHSIWDGHIGYLRSASIISKYDDVTMDEMDKEMFAQDWVRFITDTRGSMQSLSLNGNLKGLRKHYRVYAQTVLSMPVGSHVYIDIADQNKNIALAIPEQKREFMKLLGPQSQVATQPQGELQTESQLDEAASPVLFHYTGSVGAALNILKNNEFMLSISTGSVEDQYAPKGYNYFLSTTRSKVGGYHEFTGGTAVMFNLDGNWFNRRYPVKAIDYWAGFDKQKHSESEDRVFSREPTIPADAIRSVHILLKEAGEFASPTTRQLMIVAKKRGLPTYLYSDENAWKLQDTKRAIPVSKAQDLLRGRKKTGYISTYNGKKYLEPWLELIFKKSRSELSKEANKLRYSLTYWSGGQFADDLGLRNEITNARKPGNSGYEAATKIIAAMRKIGANDVKGLLTFLHKKWNAEAQQKESVEEALDANETHGWILPDRKVVYVTKEEHLGWLYSKDIDGYEEAFKLGYVRFAKTNLTFFVQGFLADLKKMYRVYAQTALGFQHIAVDVITDESGKIDNQISLDYEMPKDKAKFIKKFGPDQKTEHANSILGTVGGGAVLTDRKTGVFPWDKHMMGEPSSPKIPWLEGIEVGDSNLITEELLNEVNMSPSALKSAVDKLPLAKAGLEFELIVTDFEDLDDIDYDPYEDFESEPDYDGYDGYVRASDWQDFEREIMDFFYGDHNSRRDVQSALDRAREDYHEWLPIKFDTWANSPEIGETETRYQQWLDKTYGRDIAKQTELFPELPPLDTYAAFKKSHYDDWLENYEENGDPIEDFLDDNTGNNYFSNFSNNYNLNWPYWTEPDYDNRPSGRNGPPAESFRQAVGYPVQVSGGYHSQAQKAGYFKVEPDSSLHASSNRGGEGWEFVAPALKIPDMVDVIKKVAAWAKEGNAYTNRTTGLHMNVSLPGYNLQNLDYVKMALFLGDKYILDTFGRLGNTYTKSALDNIENVIKRDPSKAELAIIMIRTNLNKTVSKMIHDTYTDKFTSINTKDNRIEIRSPGGNWLDMDLDKVINTLYRTVYALSIALDPEAEKEEYAKKFYKLLASGAKKEDTDTIKYFSQYVSGTIPKAALLSQIRNVQAKRDISRGKNPSTEEYRITNRIDGTTVHTFYSNDPYAAYKTARDWADYNGYQFGDTRLVRVKTRAVTGNLVPTLPPISFTGDEQALGSGSNEYTIVFYNTDIEFKKVRADNLNDARDLADRWLHQHDISNGRVELRQDYMGVKHYYNIDTGEETRTVGIPGDGEMYIIRRASDNIAIAQFRDRHVNYARQTANRLASEYGYNPTSWYLTLASDDTMTPISGAGTQAPQTPQDAQQNFVLFINGSRQTTMFGTLLDVMGRARGYGRSIARDGGYPDSVQLQAPSGEMIDVPQFMTRRETDAQSVGQTQTSATIPQMPYQTAGDVFQMRNYSGDRVIAQGTYTTTREAIVAAREYANRNNIALDSYNLFRPNETQQQSGGTYVVVNRNDGTELLATQAQSFYQASQAAQRFAQERSLPLASIAIRSPNNNNLWDLQGEMIRSNATQSAPTTAGEASTTYTIVNRGTRTNNGTAIRSFQSSSFPNAVLAATLFARENNLSIPLLGIRAPDNTIYDFSGNAITAAQPEQPRQYTQAEIDRGYDIAGNAIPRPQTNITAAEGVKYQIIARGGVVHEFRAASPRGAERYAESWSNEHLGDESYEVQLAPRNESIEESLTESFLAEIRMNPKSLEAFAQTPVAQEMRVGFETEMYVPGLQGEEADPEPDYDADIDFPADASYKDRQREVIDFFTEGDYGNSRRTVERALEAFYENFSDYVSDQYYEYENSDEWKQAIADEVGVDDFSEVTEEQKDKAEFSVRENWENENDSDNWKDFLRIHEIDTMQGFANYISRETNVDSLDWPYMTDMGSAGDVTYEDLVDSFENATGYGAVGSSGYHGTNRGDYWIFEPDSSLDTPDDYGDSGVELVSPPMLLDDGLNALKTVFDWAKKNGYYTNRTTGFHIGVSIPEQTMENINHLKLVLLLGDKYVLERFGRLNSRWTKSMLDQAKKATEVRDFRKTLPQILDDARAGLLDQTNKEINKIISGTRGDRYVSVNIKSNYIEFRSAGGNYFEQYDEIRNTMLRYVRAMAAAADPEDSKQEYAKKFYKLIVDSIKQPTSTVDIFAKYVAGGISKDELIAQVTAAQKKREPVKPIGQGKIVANIESNDGDSVVEVRGKGINEIVKLANDWLRERNQNPSNYVFNWPFYSVWYATMTLSTGTSRYYPETVMLLPKTYSREEVESAIENYFIPNMTKEQRNAVNLSTYDYSDSSIATIAREINKIEEYKTDFKPSAKVLYEAFAYRIEDYNDHVIGMFDPAKYTLQQVIEIATQYAAAHDNTMLIYRGTRRLEGVGTGYGAANLGKQDINLAHVIGSGKQEFYVISTANRWVYLRVRASSYDDAITKLSQNYYRIARSIQNNNGDFELWTPQEYAAGVRKPKPQPKPQAQPQRFNIIVDRIGRANASKVFTLSRDTSGEPFIEVAADTPTEAYEILVKHYKEAGGQGLADSFTSGYEAGTFVLREV